MTQIGTQGLTSAAPGIVHLQPRLDLTCARPLAGAIGAHRGQPLTLDGSAVEGVGGLCLQVLLAAGQHWRRAGQSLRVTPVSEGFLAALAQFGLTLDAIETEHPR